MDLLNLLRPAVPWHDNNETWAGRIDQCASMLFCHGYIPMSQREKIGKKLEKQIIQAREKMKQ